MGDVIYPKQFSRAIVSRAAPPQNLLIAVDVFGTPQLALHYEGSRMPEVGRLLPDDPTATTWVLGWPDRLKIRLRVLCVYDAASEYRAELVLKCLHKLGIVPMCSTEECKNFQDDYQTGTLLPLPTKD